MGRESLPKQAKSPKTFMEESLPIIRRVVRATSRRRRLQAQDGEDFESFVMLKLIEHDYHRLRRYAGKSSLATYLMTVTQRLFLDFLVAKWGKWRPSAKALSLGPAAIELEKLVCREGLTFDDACATMQCNPRFETSEAELRALSSKIRRSQPRREVGCQLLESLPGPATVDPVNEQENVRTIHALSEKLAAAVKKLSEEDRLLLKLRFASKLTARRIGQVFDEKPSRIFNRIDRVLRTLRRELESVGVDARTVLDLCAWRGFELNLGAMLGDAELRRREL